MAKDLTYFYDAYEHPENKANALRWMKIAAVINLLLALFTLYCYFQGPQTSRLIIFLVFLTGTIIFGLIGARILPIVQRFVRGQHYARIAGGQLEFRFVAFAKIKVIPLANLEAVGINTGMIFFFYPGDKQLSFPSRYIYNDDKRMELERLLRQYFPAPKRETAGTGN